MAVSATAQAVADVAADASASAKPPSCLNPYPVSLPTVSFQSLPPELHAAIAAYLPISDSQTLSRSGPELLAIYRRLSFRRCKVALDTQVCHDANYRVIPLDVFLCPHKYSWFPSNAVYDLQILNDGAIACEPAWQRFLQLGGLDRNLYPSVKVFRLAYSVDRYDLDRLVNSNLFQSLREDVMTRQHCALVHSPMKSYINCFPSRFTSSRIDYTYFDDIVVKKADYQRKQSCQDWLSQHQKEKTVGRTIEGERLKHIQKYSNPQPWQTSQSQQLKKEERGQGAGYKEEMAAVSLEILLAVYLFDPEEPMPPLKNPDYFGMLSDLKLIGVGLSVSGMPTNLNFPRLERLSVCHSSSSFLSLIVDAAARAPKLHSFVCELAIHFKPLDEITNTTEEEIFNPTITTTNNFIPEIRKTGCVRMHGALYAQKVIELFDKIPRDIPLFSVSLMYKEDFECVCLGSWQDFLPSSNADTTTTISTSTCNNNNYPYSISPAGTVSPRLTIHSITRLNSYIPGLDVGLFINLVRLPRLSTYYMPQFGNSHLTYPPADLSGMGATLAVATLDFSRVSLCGFGPQLFDLLSAIPRDLVRLQKLFIGLSSNVSNEPTTNVKATNELFQRELAEYLEDCILSRYRLKHYQNYGAGAEHNLNNDDVMDVDGSQSEEKIEAMHSTLQNEYPQLVEALYQMLVNIKRKPQLRSGWYGEIGDRYEAFGESDYEDYHDDYEDDNESNVNGSGEESMSNSNLRWNRLNENSDDNNGDEDGFMVTHDSLDTVNRTTHKAALSNTHHHHHHHRHHQSYPLPNAEYKRSVAEFLSMMVEDPGKCFQQFQHGWKAQGTSEEAENEFARPASTINWEYDIDSIIPVNGSGMKASDYGDAGRLLLLGVCFREAVMQTIYNMPQLQFVLVSTTGTESIYPSVWLQKLLHEFRCVADTVEGKEQPKPVFCSGSRKLKQVLYSYTVTLPSVAENDDSFGNNKREFNKDVNNNNNDEYGDDDGYYYYQEDEEEEINLEYEKDCVDYWISDAYGMHPKEPWLVKTVSSNDGETQITSRRKTFRFMYDVYTKRRFIPEAIFEETDFYRQDFEGWI